MEFLDNIELIYICSIERLPLKWITSTRHSSLVTTFSLNVPVVLLLRWKRNLFFQTKSNLPEYSSYWAINFLLGKEVPWKSHCLLAIKISIFIQFELFFEWMIGERIFPFIVWCVIISANPHTKFQIPRPSKHDMDIQTNEPTNSNQKYYIIEKTVETVLGLILISSCFFLGTWMNEIDWS